MALESERLCHYCSRCSFSAMVLATTRILIPAVLTAAFAFLSIRSDETTILDFIKYAVRYFISTQQYYEWRLKGEQKKEK